jgi:hypothetical protein
MFLDAAKLLKNVVARDGIAQHYTALTIPLNGIFLDPALGLRCS